MTASVLGNLGHIVGALKYHIACHVEWKGSQIMVIHTGGLQGIVGFRQRFGDGLLLDWSY